MIFNRIFAFILISMSSLSQSVGFPNRNSLCKEDMTSCKLSSGKYGCCSLPLAHCCSDGLHCCPNGTKCDNREGLCHPIKQQKRFSRIKLKSNELCPDKKQICHKFETCCKEKTGSYGCCPYNLAVCCKDLLHCCPHGTTCDLIHRQCVHPSNHIDDNRGFSFDKTMHLIGFESKNISDIVCPGGRYDCPDKNTCCQISETLWGCCPLENAVCCDDRIHCCPNGYKCSQSGCQSFR